MDIEEIKRLNEARVVGDWWGITIKGGGTVCSRYEGENYNICHIDEGWGRNTTDFIAAAPAIAQKCIDLDDVNREVVSALKEALWQIKRMSNILDQNNLNGGLYDFDGPIQRAVSSLKKAGAL